MLNKIDHIGIAVKSLERAKEFYEKILGLKPSSIESVHSQMVDTIFFQIGDTRIEFLEGRSPESPITKFIEKKGEGIHHICFEVDNLQKTLLKLQKAGIDLIDKSPKIGAHNKKVAFIHPKSTNGILTELTEKDKEN